MNERYQIDPTRLRGQADIIEYIKDINERVRTGETGLRIGHTSIEDGDLIVLNGDIRVKESDGTTVLRLVHGGVPEIRMFPLGDTDTHMVTFFGFDFDLGSGPDQGVQLDIEKSDFVIDGGKVLLTKSYAILSHQPDGAQETYMWLNIDPDVDEIISFRGKMRNSWMYDTRQMFYCGRFNFTSGFSTWTHTYSFPWNDDILPVVNVTLNGATLEWNLDGFSTSSFTVRSNNTVNNKVVTFLNIRCN